MQWSWYPLKDGDSWPVEGSLNYNTISQLDQFRRKQEKWVEVPSVLLLISLRDIPDLCPKGTDLCLKPTVPSSSPTLPLYLGLPNEQAESGLPTRRGCLSLRRILRESKRYMEGFMGLTLPYDLTWRDVVHVLGGTLTPDSRA